MMYISVVVCTVRKDKVLQFLESLFASEYEKAEVIIVSQGYKFGRLRGSLGLSKNFKVRSFFMEGYGLSRARNLGIKKAKGEIIAFTDDDCLVDKNWLLRIDKSFRENGSVVGIFGQTRSYQSHRNKGKFCPCTFIKSKKAVIEKPCLHWKSIGFGNNMAFRREVFGKEGGFQEWLGVGSVGKSAEDAEFALRLLSRGYKLLYDSGILVYHNRWLAQEELRQQSLFYSCGEVACYGYFAFQGKKFAEEVVRDNFRDSFNNLKISAKLVVNAKEKSVSKFLWSLRELFSRLRGLMIAYFYSRKGFYQA